MRRLTKKAVVEALRASRGVVSGAARSLGVSRQALYKAIKRYGLEGFLQEARDELLEHVEVKLIEAALRGEPWAVKLVLKRFGRDRGYVEHKEVVSVGKLEVELVEVSPQAPPPK